MKPPFRIAILECDTPLDETKAKFGSYGGCFESLLRAGARSLDALDRHESLQLTFWDVVDKRQYPSLDTVDAVLLTGSSMYHGLFRSRGPV